MSYKSSVIPINKRLLSTHQLPNQCGPTALSIVMRYWGVNKTPDKISSLIYSPSLKGTYSLSMLLYIKSLKNLNGLLYKSNMEDLQLKISNGYPIILGLKKRNVEFLHFVVAYGYEEDKIIIHDGLKPKVVINKSSLDKMWQNAKYIALWIYPKDYLND
jgi:ABC-type bacteriocin/lantibiotic exporter with double-glycine peptidase domain